MHFLTLSFWPVLSCFCIYLPRYYILSVLVVWTQITISEGYLLLLIASFTFFVQLKILLMRGFFSGQHTLFGAHKVTGIYIDLDERQQAKKSHHSPWVDAAHH